MFTEVFFINVMVCLNAPLKDFKDFKKQKKCSCSRGSRENFDLVVASIIVERMMLIGHQDYDDLTTLDFFFCF